MDLRAEFSFDSKALISAINDHTSEDVEFATLLDYISNSNNGTRAMTKQTVSIMNKLSNICENYKRAAEKRSVPGMKSFVTWQMFIAHLIAVKGRFYDNMDFFFDFEKHADYIARTTDHSIIIKTDYFKDTLIDWMLVALSISTMRVVVVLPDDVSVRSYELALKNTLSFQSTQPEEFSKLIQSFYDTTYELSTKPTAKVLLMSCRTLTRLFTLRMHSIFEEVDIALVAFGH